MKKITTTIVLIAFIFIGSAQRNSAFLRHDTTVLKASECNWLLPTNLKNDSAHTVSEWLIHSIQNGKILAIDNETGKKIPATEILLSMSRDTIAVSNGMVDTFIVERQKIEPSKISKIKIYQDWYLDESGKIFSRILSIDLMIEVSNPMGEFIGYKPFCRINYDGIAQ